MISGFLARLAEGRKRTNLAVLRHASVGLLCIFIGFTTKAWIKPEPVVYFWRVALGSAVAIIGKIVAGPQGGVSPVLVFEPKGRDNGRPPTAAMKRFAESLARQKGIKPPAGYTKSGSVCRSFLEQHAPKKAEGVNENTVGDPRARPPSPAQISFSESIAREKGVAIPDEAKASSSAMSLWIDNQGRSLAKQHEVRR